MAHHDDEDAALTSDDDVVAGAKHGSEVALHAVIAWVRTSYSIAPRITCHVLTEALGCAAVACVTEHPEMRHAILADIEKLRLFVAASGQPQ